MNVPDHPAIHAIERTGYAKEIEFVHCDQCDGEVYKGEYLFEWKADSGEITYLCEECLIAKFHDLSIKEQAELLDAKMIVYGKDGKK